MQPIDGALPANIDDLPLLIPMGIGLLLGAIASIWLLVRAFGAGIGWGLAVLLVPVFGHVVFFFAHFKKAIWPTLLMLLGMCLIAAPAVFLFLKGKEVSKDAVIQSVPAKTNAAPGADEPELRLTLTAAKREDYAQLKSNKSFAVIQWANKDVTDDDSELLHGMVKLRELDLNDTAITDEALHVLEDMPKLEILRLARTKITEAGFKEHIEPMDTLMELDLRGTKVPAKSARDWKAAKPGRKLAI